MSRLSVYAEIEFPANKSSEAKRLIGKLVQAARNIDPGTERYDFYVSQNMTTARLVEVYETPQALEAHLANLASVVSGGPSIQSKVHAQVLGTTPSETSAALQAAGFSFESYHRVAGIWKPQPCKQPFVLMASVKVQPGKQEEFKHLAHKLCEVVDAQDAHTLQYEWFMDHHEQHCKILEVYTSERGYLEHVEHLSSRLPQFGEVITDASMEVLGQLTEATRQTMGELLSGHWEFFDGLDA